MSYFSPYEALGRPGDIPKDELLQALKDGVIVAEGVHLVGSDWWRLTDDERFPFERGVDLSASAEPIPKDWWLRAGLGVTVHWPAAALDREVGGKTEFMMQVRIKRADLQRLWPRRQVPEGHQARPGRTGRRVVRGRSRRLPDGGD